MGGFSHTEDEVHQRQIAFKQLVIHSAPPGAHYLSRLISTLIEAGNIHSGLRLAMFSTT